MEEKRWPYEFRKRRKRKTRSAKPSTRFPVGGHTHYSPLLLAGGEDAWTSWTVIGLIVELFGVLMIFRWGPPQPNFEWEEHDVVVAGDGSPSDGSRRRRYQIMASIALGLVFIGLALQLFDALKLR